MTDTKENRMDFPGPWFGFSEAERDLIHRAWRQARMMGVVRPVVLLADSSGGRETPGGRLMRAIKPPRPATAEELAALDPGGGAMLSDVEVEEYTIGVVACACAPPEALDRIAAAGLDTMPPPFGPDPAAGIPERPKLVVFCARGDRFSWSEDSEAPEE